MRRRYQNLSKEEKEKRGNMDVNGIKISLEMKKKGLLRTEKKYKMKKTLRNH